MLSRPIRLVYPSLMCAVIACVLSTACGGSQAATPSTAPSPPAVTPVPDEPMQLIPADATQLVRVDVAALRNWSEYARLSPLVSGADCDDGPVLLQLLERFDRIAIAGLPRGAGQREGGEPDGLVVAHGRIDDGTPQQLLETVLLAPGAQPRATTRSMVGRFEVLSDGKMAAAALDGKVLVLGSPATVEAALGLATAAQPGEGSVYATERVQKLQLSQRLAGGFLLPASRSARELEQGVTKLGGPELGSAIAEAATAFSIDIGEGMRVEVRSELASPQIAGDLMGRIHQMAAQATMFLRMFRLPPLQDRLDLSIEDRTLVVVLELPQDEVTRVSALAETTLKQPACPEKPAPPPTPAPASKPIAGGPT